MPFSKYIIGLAISVIASLLVYFLAQFIIPVGPYLNMTVFSVILFSLLSLTMYLLGKASLNSKGKNAFIFLIINNVFFKLLISFLFVFLYAKNYAPTDSFFIIPFLWVYLIFLIFETYYLSKQAKNIK